MDFSILYALQHLHNAVLDRVMVGITSLGNAGWIWIALTAVFLILPKYRKCGVRMAIALILDLILCNLVLKPLAARPRPCWIDEQVSCWLPLRRTIPSHRAIRQLRLRRQSLFL